MTRRICTITLIGAAIAWLSAPVASAEEAATAADEWIEIERDAVTLQDELRVRDIDRDVADTALVFTNLGNTDGYAHCMAFDGDGRRIGRARVKLPALGVRYLLASDISRGRDFIGHAQCGAAVTVKGTAIFLGPGLTDLPSMQPSIQPAATALYGRIRFPLVATY
jgi:hypothetical protein